MNKARKIRKRKPPTQEQILRRQKTLFKRKIYNIFTGAGFKYISTNDHEMKIGFRTVEIDSLYIFENIWLICEDTIKEANIRDHIRTKNEAFGEIRNNIDEFKNKLVELFPDKKDILEKYDTYRIKPFCLYISKNEISLADEDYDLFNNLIFIQPKTLGYLQWIVKSIKNSARYEIFRFLKVNNEDIGSTSSTSTDSLIKAPIIYPRQVTGLTNRVRVVSFMMSAEDLLNTCYVLRKDNWEQSIWLYQRLIEPNKIKKIRDFIEEKGETFYNNVIVALPDNVAFKDGADNYVDIEKIGDFEGNCKLIIPKELNSICVIDGQHRIFAHYESGVDSKQERCISELRKQLHLLVTGLVFPRDMKAEERAKIQSEIFLDINSNAKPVPANVLLQIKRIKNPIADESIAQFVVEQLNQGGIFEKMLQISSLDSGKIKTASIVRFALRYLVTVTPTEGKKSLFEFWNGDKEALLSIDDSAIKSYVNYCTSVLREYFGAIKKNFHKDWDDGESKLLTVISLNGFIIALNRQLAINGVHDFDYYDKLFSTWTFNFSKEEFLYTSSQYRKLSTQILREVFGLNEEDIEKI